MKNTLTLWMLGAMLMAGCSPREERLTFHVGGTPNEIAFFSELVEQFKEEHGIEVVINRSTTQTEQRKQQLLISLRGKKSDPDVMLMDVAWIGQMAASGWLESLEPYGIAKEPFFSRIVDLADTWQGKLIGVPLYVDGGVLYYRKDLLEKYGFDGPPHTWEELEHMAKTVMEKEQGDGEDFWGYVWQGAQYEGLVCNALEVFTSAGGGFMTDDMTPVLDSRENERALATMAGFILESKISPPNTYADMKEEEVRLVFDNGNALFERNWPYAWALHNKTSSPVAGKVGIAPLPAFEGHAGASTLGGWHLALSHYSDKKKEGAAFIEYLTSYAVQKKMALELGWNPGRTDVYGDEDVLEKYPVLASLKAAFARAVPRPAVPWYSEISLIMQKYFNRALSGTADAAMVLKQAQKEVKKSVASYQK